MTRRAHGFSLIEMAFVLIIVTLLLGGLLVPFATQVEQKRIAETQKAMEEIKEALLGFALATQRLPCPDTTGDGVEDVCGDTSSSSSGGNLPWVTLGTVNSDSWGRFYQYRVNGAFTSNAAFFSLTTTGTSSGSNSGILQICTDRTCAASVANNVPAIIYSSGSNGAVQPPTALDELENTKVPTPGPGNKFDRIFVSRIITAPGAPVGEFDDIVTWISPNVLFNRMVAAGQLP